MDTKGGRKRPLDVLNEVLEGSPEARWRFGLLIELGHDYTWTSATLDAKMDDKWR